MHIYVESLTNLLGRNEKRSEICVKVGKCFRNGDNSMFVEINEGMKSLLESSKENNESDTSFYSLFSSLLESIGLSKSPDSYHSSESNESSAESLENKEIPINKMRLVGASPCSFGPSYWCSSQETINECKVRIFFESISIISKLKAI